MSRLALAGLVLGLVLGGLAGNAWRDRSARAELAERDRDRERMVSRAATDQTAAVEKVRAEERRGRVLLQKALDDEYLLRTQSQAAARRADAAGRGLHAELDATRAALEARAAGDPAAASSCTAESAAAGVLAELYRTCSDRRRAVALYADAAARQGLTCERAHDALMR